MKKMMISILLGLTIGLMGCSSNSDSKPAGNGGAVTEFGNKTSGQWLSECIQSQQGNYKETLVINANGTGSNTDNFYQDQNCQGNVVRTEGPTAFTYTAEPPVNGVSKVTLTFTGQQPVQVNVIIQNDTLEISNDQAKVRYARVGPPTQTETQTPGLNPGNPNDFDSLAKGNWVTEQCFPYENNQSVQQVVSIAGQGRLSTVLNVYPSADCTGTPRAEQKQVLNYTVTRFANGGGQIMINGNPSDISFQGSRMTVTTAQGTTEFVRIN